MRPSFRGIAKMLIILSCMLLTGCYDATEIDDLAYASAIGLDKGTTNELRMTLQIMVPTAIAGGGGSGDSGGVGGKETSTVTTIETPTVYSGFTMINNYLTKQINVSHAKLLVISEDLAKEGIGQYIHALIRGREFRGTIHVAVSKCKAEDYIKEVKPILEANVSKYHELRHSSYQYTSFTTSSQLIDFYLRQECTCSQAVANLVDKSKYKSTDEFTNDESTYMKKGRTKPLEGDYLAGGIPQVGEVKNEVMGLAVFDGDKMVGELDGEETTFFLMLSGQFKRAYITFTDPLVNDQYIVLDVRQRGAPRKNTILQNDMPYCEAELSLEADILSIQSEINYESVENLPILERAAEDFIRTGIYRFLEKTTKELNSDICAFGMELKKKMMLWEDWERINWLSRYKDASFNINVKMHIRRTGLIIRTSPDFSSKGKNY